VKASLASHTAPLDLGDGGRMVDVEITSPVATCSLRARAHVVDETLVLDLLDLPLEDYPSRDQQNRLHQIVSHVGETCALTNPRNIPLVRRRA
jgi:hypothetical protein